MNMKVVHTNVLEITLRLALQTSCQRLEGHSVVVMDDSTTIVAYINKQQGMVSPLCANWQSRFSLGHCCMRCNWKPGTSLVKRTLWQIPTLSSDKRSYP